MDHFEKLYAAMLNSMLEDVDRGPMEEVDLIIESLEDLEYLEEVKMWCAHSDISFNAFMKLIKERIIARKKRKDKRIK